jgi:hypothetical protein
VAKEIKAGVEINLRDLFSSGMHKAAGAASDFAGKTIGAIGQVDKALSGTAAKIGALGVTLSLGAATKGIIEMDHRMTRLGLSVNASAEQVAKLKKDIFEAALAPEVKIDSSNLLRGIEVIINGTNDLKYAEDNIRNVALAIQATGESGDSIGAIFTEFQKFNYTSEQISSFMDDIVAQSNEGAFSLAEFAKAAPQIFSAYSRIGTAPENIKKANAALQILNAGTKSPIKAVSTFNTAMEELADTEKQQKLRQLGVHVKDSAGNFRDFNDIMFDIVAKANELGSTDRFNNIFSASTMQGIRSYMAHGERMIGNLTDLGDTAGLLQKQSATMAGTLQSNMQNLQTAFNRFADSNLAKPLEHITDLLNKMAEDPKRVEAVFNAVKRGVLIIAGLKVGAGILSFLSTIRSFQGGNSNATITEKLSLQTNSGAMPVYVTNWGGATSGPIGAASLSGAKTGGLVDQYGNPLSPSAATVPATSVAPTAPTTPTAKGKWNLNKPNMKGAAKAGAGAAIVTAALALPGMVSELGEISKNEDLTKEERGTAKGGAVGDFVGSIGGAAGGAMIGAAIGSIVPGAGTVIGALVGGVVGQIGGPLGRFIGEKIGAAVSKEKTPDDTTERPQKTRQAGTFLGGIERPQAGQSKTPEPTDFETAGTFLRGFEMPPMKPPSQVRIPESALPPKITQTKTVFAPPAKAELEGQATLEVNVNLSGERPTAHVAVKNNSTPFNFRNAGSARLARTLAI